MKVKFLIIVALLFGLTADTIAQKKKYKSKKHYRKGPYHKVYKPRPPAPRGAVVVLPPAPRHPAVVTLPAPPRPKLPPPPPRPPLPGGGR
jgi:hypothetical protein